MTERRVLPERRSSETFELDFGGLKKAYTITIGYYDGGEIGEVFINGGKSGEAVEAVARDAAVVLSIALQFGASLDTMRHAITRDDRGAPATVVGAVLDRLCP